MSIHPMLRRWVPLLLVALLVLPATGCGIFSPDEDKGTPPPGGGGDFPPADNPEQLMTNFVDAYELQRISEYEKIIHDQFEFFFSEADQQELFNGSAPDWDRTKEIAATTKMFEGQPGTDPVTQEVIPPILDINLTLTPLTETWEDASGVGELFAGTFRRLYKVNMNVTYQGEDLTTRVTGDNMFYITRDEETDLFQIKYWEDLGTDSGG